MIGFYILHSIVVITQSYEYIRLTITHPGLWIPASACAYRSGTWKKGQIVNRSDKNQYIKQHQVNSINSSVPDNQSIFAIQTAENSKNAENIRKTVYIKPH